MRAADKVRDAVIGDVRDAYRNDWAQHELVEVAKASARSQHARLTTREARKLVGEAVPHVVV